MGGAAARKHFVFYSNEGGAGLVDIYVEAGAAALHSPTWSRAQPPPPPPGPAASTPFSPLRPHGLRRERRRSAPRPVAAAARGAGAGWREDGGGRRRVSVTAARAWPPREPWR